MIEHAALHWPPALFAVVAASLIAFAVVLVCGCLAGLGWLLWIIFRRPRRLEPRRNWRV